jgi:predicted SAM-dependent methyltransferase
VAARVRFLAPYQRFRFRRARQLWVNVGCGAHGRDGWTNMDVRRFGGVNCLFDSRKVLPFPDRSVTALFTEHFLEHLEYTEEVFSFLGECLRVLEPGGRLRIIVPDAELYIRAYVEGGWTSLAAIRNLSSEREDPFTPSSYHTRMELLNVVFHQGGEHRFGYDFETIASVLHRIGFTEVEQLKFGHSRLSGLALDRPSRKTESLYVEAMRGAWIPESET